MGFPNLFGSFSPFIHERNMILQYICVYYTNTGGYSIRVLRNLNSEIRKESAEWSQETGYS